MQIVQNKCKKLKTLILTLKSNDRRQEIASKTPDELDRFVDEMIADLENSLLSQTNDLRDRIKQARPECNDPLYEKKMIIYKELLELMVVIMKKLQIIVAQTLDELHALIGQLWDDICKNNGQQIERLLEEHQRRIQVQMNGEFMEDINQIEKKLQTLCNVEKDNTQF